MPARLGSSLFSADDIYPQLQKFWSRLSSTGHAGKPLYFAKLDVRSCFDTIPHQPLMEMLNRLFTSSEYAISRHAEAKVLGGLPKASSAIVPKVTWKYLGKAHAVHQMDGFSTTVENDATGKRGVVFVDNVVRMKESRHKIMLLLKEHVERNVVQIGKNYYRQRTGIPQGSIVSSLLCSFFYAELEREVLGFVQQGETLLLRLIDDFLLISTNRDVATRFVQVMHAGVPRYGLAVKAEKSKVNFDVEVNDQAVARLPAISDFPYCGVMINTVDLNIKKDEARRQKNSKRKMVL